MSTAVPTRVLYVVSLFPVLSETFIVREIHALIERGVDVRILSLKPPRELMVQPQAAKLMDRVLHPAGKWRTMVAAAGVAIRQPVLTAGIVATMLGELWRQPETLGKSLVAVARALGRIEEIRRFDPQLLHAPWANYPSTVAWCLSRMLSRPFSFTSRAHDIFVQDQMMVRKLESAALAVTITEHNVRFMARWMPTPGAIPVHVIHSSLNLSEIPYVRTGRHQRELLAVGRLVPSKGLEVLLMALATLHARGVEFNCTIIGDGSERSRLETLRNRLGLDAVVGFSGSKSQDEVMCHIAQATMMVLPCVVTPSGNSDGIPNVLMESMAAGLPVISTRVSGIPELVDDGVNGRLVAPNDAAALADMVQELLDDPQQCERLAIAGRRKVECDFDVRIEAGRLLEHFGASCHA